MRHSITYARRILSHGCAFPGTLVIFHFQSIRGYLFLASIRYVDFCVILVRRFAYFRYAFRTTRIKRGILHLGTHSYPLR